MIRSANTNVFLLIFTGSVTAVCVVLTFTENRKYDDNDIVSYFKVVTGGTLGHIKGKCVCVCVCYLLLNISFITFYL